MTVQELATICMACPFKQQDGGFHICGADEKNIISHAAAGQCPKGRYSLPVAPVRPVASRGLGDTIAKVTAAAQPPGPRFAGQHASALATVAHGAAGLAKAVLGVGRADDATIERRRTVCAICPEHTVALGGVLKCKACGCATTPKTANESERCPRGKW